MEVFPPELLRRQPEQARAWAQGIRSLDELTTDLVASDIAQNIPWAKALGYGIPQPEYVLTLLKAKKARLKS